MASAGVVARQPIGRGIVALGEEADHFRQVVASGQGVGGGVVEVLRDEGVYPGVVGPFEGGGVGQLHEPDLAGASGGEGVEAAFFPDHGFYQRGIKVELPGRGDNNAIEATEGLFIQPTLQ